MQVSAEQAKRMVGYIEKTQPIIEKVAKTEAAIQKLAPKVVDALIEKGALDASQRDRAIVNIQDPVKALESLQKFAAASGGVPRAPAPEALGTPAREEKSAANNGTKKESAADRLFLSRFGF